jgi:hypothetical protein
MRVRTKTPFAWFVGRHIRAHFCKMIVRHFFFFKINLVSANKLLFRFDIHVIHRTLWISAKFHKFKETNGKTIFIPGMSEFAPIAQIAARSVSAFLRSMKMPRPLDWVVV